MKVPEGGLFFTEELSAKRTISPEEVSGQGNDIKLVDVVIQQAYSLANSSPPAEWLKRIMNDGAESSLTRKKQLKIPKIRKMFRDIESNRGCYDPLVVSIGPYHHGKPELQEIEELKTEMAKQYVNKTKKELPSSVEDVAGALYMKVKDVAPQAKEYYESSPAIDDQSFTQMMFLDGCFILQFIYLFVNNEQDLRKKIVNNEQDLRKTIPLTEFVLRDLFLLENQLPYIVLEALMSMTCQDGEVIGNFIKLNKLHHPPTNLWTDDLRHLINEIFHEDKQPTNKSRSPEYGEHLHLLNMMRKTFPRKTFPTETFSKERNAGTQHTADWSQKYQSAKELKTVGIRFRAHRSDSTDIRFSSTMFLYGKVTLPRLVIDDFAKSMLLNILAFETCPYVPDYLSVTSYICFMDSLINNAEDVMVLRSQNVLVNCLGSDQDVADLFNGLAKNLAPDYQAFGEVQKDIIGHYNNHFKIWMAEWLDAHFSSPWTVLAFLGAIFAIILSVIQTYVALNPPSN